MSFKKVTHVIFDLDGLLIDSEGMYDEIIGEIAKKYGKEYTFEARMKVLGTPEPITAKLVVEELKLPISTDEFLEQYKRGVAEKLKNPPLLPGAEKLIRHFHEHNVPICLATSSSTEACSIKLQNYENLFSLFHHKVMGSSDPEVKRGKPAPDIYLVAASRFPDNPKPEECLVFEDAPNGVIGAKTAGMQVVMVPAADIQDELKKPATLVLKSLTDFDPTLFGLPALNNIQH
ncbi:probable pseudouridine-5'-phosphatase [Agrilus planipennis]|uniref:pseudouridine 5'-phosphatase n=1 Tax=Agrilus planipennis TaxID=224129 RepID=A0A1W4WI03_AGRPL|nr:probable pseudouridine-5'-phosphatase [Agrilus planipennis]